MQATTTGPVAELFNRFASCHRYRYDILRRGEQGEIQQGRQPATSLDLGTGPLRVIGATLSWFQLILLEVLSPDPFALFHAR